MKGKFDPLYFLTGKNPADPTQPVSEDWIKAGSGLWKGGIILVFLFLLAYGGVSLWNRIFPKPAQNVNTANFPNAQHVDYSVIQINEKTKPWIHVIPYVDSSVGVSNKYTTYFGQSKNSDWEIRAGVRMELDGLFDALFTKQKSTQDVKNTVSTISEK